MSALQMHRRRAVRRAPRSNAEDLEQAIRRHLYGERRHVDRLVDLTMQIERRESGVSAGGRERART
jgi:hypothetical protein